MRIARVSAFAFTAVCLVIAGFSLLRPTTMTLCAGSDCSTIDCGSPAFPKALIDFEQPGEATNCAGQTSASTALYCVFLACVGVGAVGLTSRRGTAEVQPVPTDKVDATA